MQIKNCNHTQLFWLFLQNFTKVIIASTDVFPWWIFIRESWQYLWKLMCPWISCFLKNGPSSFSVADVHLTAVCLKIHCKAFHMSTCSINKKEFRIQNECNVIKLHKISYWLTTLIFSTDIHTFKWIHYGLFNIASTDECQYSTVRSPRNNGVHR